MEGEEALSEEGDWKVVACVQGSSGWQDRLEEDDRDRQDSPPATSLNAEFRSDLEWWRTFLRHWNGRSMMSIHTTAH